MKGESKMKRKLIAVLATAIFMLAIAPVVQAAGVEGDLGLAGSSVWSDITTYKNCYPTSACGTATNYRYGNIIDCRKAELIEWCVTTSSTGATTYVIVGVEWLADDPSDPDEDGPYADVQYYPGFGLLEGTAATTATKANLDHWTFKEHFMLYDTMTTLPTSNVNQTTATISLGLIWDTGLNQYRAQTVTKAPYCRPFVYYKVADTTSAWVVLTDGAPIGQGLVRIGAILRYRQYPPVRTDEANEVNGTWYGYPFVW
jgi:hypothetical protein